MFVRWGAHKDHRIVAVVLDEINRGIAMVAQRDLFRPEQHIDVAVRDADSDAAAR